MARADRCSAGFPGNWALGPTGLTGEISTKIRYINFTSYPTSIAASYKIFTIPAKTLVKNVIPIMVSAPSISVCFTLGDTSQSALWGSIELLSFTGNSRGVSVNSTASYMYYYHTANEIVMYMDATGTGGSCSSGAVGVYVEFVKLDEVDG